MQGVGFMINLQQKLNIKIRFSEDDSLFTIISKKTKNFPNLQNSRYKIINNNRFNDNCFFVFFSIQIRFFFSVNESWVLLDALLFAKHFFFYISCINIEPFWIISYMPTWIIRSGIICWWTTWITFVFYFQKENWTKIVKSFFFF